MLGTEEDRGEGGSAQWEWGRGGQLLQKKNMQRKARGDWKGIYMRARTGKWGWVSSPQSWDPRAPLASLCQPKGVRGTWRG